MSWTSDLRYVLRALRRSPTFTLAAVATLALSIGATTAIFSAVNGILLRPLPFPDAGRLVVMCERHPSVPAGFCIGSPPNAADWAAASRTLDAVGVARDWPFLVRDESGSETLDGGVATADFFRVLGVQPGLGRLIAPGEEGGARVVVLSHALWRGRFGGDSSLVGKTITLDHEPYTVVGVLPAGVTIPGMEWIQLWTPLPFGQRLEENRKWRGFRVYGRLAHGASLTQARDELSRIAAGLAETHPETNQGWAIEVEGLQGHLVGSVERALLVLLGAVAFVLLIGCANVANLVLGRVTHRSRELAVRAALGSGAWVAGRLILLEALVLGILGGVLGLVLSFWGLDVFLRLAPGGIPRLHDVRVDGWVFAFALALSCLTSVLFGAAGLFPALRLNLSDALRQREGTPGRSRVGLRGALVVAEMALALMLLTGAGLFLKSFSRLASWNPGFEVQHLTSTWLLASQTKYPTGPQVADLFQRAVEEVASLPGVVSAGAASAGPGFGGTETGELRIVGRASEGEPPTARWFDVDDNYFTTLGVPLLRGRGFTATDAAGAPGVALVNETMARRYWPGRDPVGQQVVMYDRGMTIVGVVADVPPLSSGEPAAPEIYWPNQQAPRWATYVIIRSAADPATVTGAARRRLQQLDPDLSVPEFQSLEARFGRQLVYPRFVTLLMAVFAGIALALAAVGVYGVIAYGVARRTREIGIQVAMGASRGDILRAVLMQGLVLTLAGAVIGAAGAVAISPVLRSLLAGVEPGDPLTLLAVAVVLVLVALVASYVPARRASGISPLEALREE